MENLNKEKIFQTKKTIYGPIKSWRFGQSLGVDPLFSTSICSFNCIYCQLGHIQKITTEIKDYVSTEKVIRDYQDFLQEKIEFDVITFSGSGEPTLARNLGEISQELRELSPEKPQIILTNATLLHIEERREVLKSFDRVILKLDIGRPEDLIKVNRPASGVTLEKIIKGIKLFKKSYQGIVEIQSMFMPINQKNLGPYIQTLREIAPDIVQLNTPKRPYPLDWYRENRGNHLGLHDHPTQNLQTLNLLDAQEVQKEIEEKTQLKVLSIYQNS